MAELHQVAAAFFRHRDLCSIVGYPFDNRVVLFIDLLANKVANIADDLEIQTLVEITHRLDGRYAGRCDHIINVNLSGGTCGGDACPVIVPEQVDIFRVLRKLHLQLCPAVALELLGGLTAGRIFKNTLVVIIGAAGDPGISLEGDDRALGQHFTKVDAEGRPVIAVVA